MYSNLKTRFSAVIICGFITAGILFAPGIGLGAGTESRRMGGSAITLDVDNPLHPDYPGAFDNVGRMDRIADGEVVISDSLYRLSSAVTYHTPRDSSASQSAFHTGDYVGCLMNAAGEVESIWLIRGQER
jgi:hypothetical protein